MIQLGKSLVAWGTPAFEATVKSEIAALGPAPLPLQSALAHSSYVTDEPVEVVVIAAADAGAALRVRAGIFYRGIIAGCSCVDDPTPVEPTSEYCELEFAIDKATGRAQVSFAE